MRVVDRLEAIEIDERDRERAIGARRDRALAVVDLRDGGAVCEPGQRVSHRAPLELADILKAGDRVEELATRVVNRRPDHVERDDLVVTSDLHVGDLADFSRERAYDRQPLGGIRSVGARLEGLVGLGQTLRRARHDPAPEELLRVLVRVIRFAVCGEHEDADRNLLEQAERRLRLLGFLAREQGAADPRVADDQDRDDDRDRSEQDGEERDRALRRLGRPRACAGERFALDGAELGDLPGELILHRPRLALPDPARFVGCGREHRDRAITGRVEPPDQRHDLGQRPFAIAQARDSSVQLGLRRGACLEHQRIAGQQISADACRAAEQRDLHSRRVDHALGVRVADGLICSA